MSRGPSNGDRAADFRGKRLAVSIATHNRVQSMSERGQSLPNWAVGTTSAFPLLATR